MDNLPDFDTPSDALDFLNKGLTAPPDPAASAIYPNGLALDIALEAATLPELMEAYHLTPVQLKQILRNPAFRAELQSYKLAIKEDGFSFRQKARAQAEEYLHTAWKLVHSPDVPASVKADLIKNTVKWGGLEAPPPATPGIAGNMVTPQMLEDLKSLPDSELEIRVMQVLVKRGQHPAAAALEDPLSAAIDGEFEEE